MGAITSGRIKNKKCVYNPADMEGTAKNVCTTLQIWRVQPKKQQSERISQATPYTVN
jgi:hypothetical protein